MNESSINGPGRYGVALLRVGRPGGGWEYPVFLIVVSVAVWLLDDGAFVVRRTGDLTPSVSGSAA